MKKYATSCTAIVLALLLTAAPTTSADRSFNKKQDLVVYYWYMVNEFGEMGVNSLQFGGQPRTIWYAENNDGCWGYMFECMRGFFEPLQYLPSYEYSDLVTTRNGL